jgi:hypothetical protein
MSSGRTRKATDAIDNQARRAGEIRSPFQFQRASGRIALVTFVSTVLILGACVPPRPAEISRERAVEIARSNVTFQVTSVDAVKTSANGRPIWRVTVRGRLPGQPPLLFETSVFEVDRRTGQIVAVART